MNTNRLLTMVVVMCAASGALAGANIEWTGLGLTSAWSDGGNWQGGQAPGAGDKAVIPSGMTVYMSGDDVAFVKAEGATLAGISLPAADSTLCITNTAEIGLPVPLSGNGAVQILNCGKGKTYGFSLTADNSGYTGPMLISNCVVSTGWTHATSFGKDNVVTCFLNKDNTKIQVFTGGKYTSTFVIFGIETYNNSSLIANGGSIEFTKPITVHGFLTLDCSPVTNGAKISGGLNHTGPGRITTYGNWTIDGETPLNLATTTGCESGLFITQNTLSLGSPVDPSSPRVGAGGGGVLKFLAPHLLSPRIGFQIGLAANKYHGSMDLNGCDQEIGTVFKMMNGGNTYDKTYVTSASPATLTVFGQLEWYGNQPSAENRYLEFALNGAASLEFNGTNRIVTSQGAVVWPKITQTNAVSTTTGGIGVRRGTYTITGGNRMPNLTRLEVSNEGELVVNSSDINPGHFNMMVTNLATRSGQYPLTLGAGVVLQADKAAFGDNTQHQGWLMPGTYGGPAAREAGLVDEEHTIGFIGGTGLLKVSRYGHPGFMLLLR